MGAEDMNLTYHVAQLSAASRVEAAKAAAEQCARQERLSELLARSDDEVVIAQVLKDPADADVLLQMITDTLADVQPEIERMEALALCGETLRGLMPPNLPERIRKHFTDALDENVTQIVDGCRHARLVVDRAKNLKALLDKAKAKATDCGGLE